MTAWIIEPREPIIVRDGRPFEPQPGVIANTLPFPFPSTTAGAARNRAGSRDGVFIARGDLETLKKIQVRGPLLAEADDEEKWTLLVPAPADALLLEVKDDEEKVRRKPLVPLQPKADEFVDRPTDAKGQELALVGPRLYEAAKPAKDLPAFWRWEPFAQWLLRSKEEVEQKEGIVLARSDLGIRPLPQDERLHVSLETGQMVAREGALFGTRGLEFTSQAKKLSQTRRLALWLDVDEDGKYPIHEGLWSLGGERRMVKWQKGSPERSTFDELRDKVSAQIHATGCCRLILLTPAYFERGYLPNTARWEYKGVKPVLQAALVQRPQVVSGWDMAKGPKNAAKPTRRLVPAGSVFFLKLEGQLANLNDWIKHTWMSCVSDDVQSRSDGFGLAVLGNWDRKPYETEIKEDE